MSLFDKVKHVHGLRCIANHSIRAIMWYVRRCRSTAVLGRSLRRTCSNSQQAATSSTTERGHKQAMPRHRSSYRCPPFLPSFLPSFLPFFPPSFPSPPSLSARQTLRLQVLLRCSSTRVRCRSARCTNPSPNVRKPQLPSTTHTLSTHRYSSTTHLPHPLPPPLHPPAIQLFSRPL